VKEDIPTVYQPKDIEDKWYDFWLKKGYFKAEIDSKKTPFTIVIPPPNVTGSLHMGHALNNTLQDILIRTKRMQGKITLWLPGTDHAGIATQNVVEKELAKEKLSRQALGREKFLERVWQWKEEYGNTIINQLKKLGASCDWTRLRFTMDKDYSRAIQETFVQLYKKGLIYKGKYIINWCPRCQTALSDIEVEHRQTKGSLYYIKYFFDSSSDFVTVATTRPETMLGDTAVAVHPQDSRYKKLIGKTLILPILERRIPLIADEYADPEFGSGAVKVTPAHDLSDFEAGRRHNLPQIIVIGPQGKMTREAGPYQGMERYLCRERLVKDLKEKGYLEKVEDYPLPLAFCARCQEVIEPLLSEQWFVKMKELAKPAISVVKEGKIKFIPSRWAKVYLDWLENIKDWCISRQIWWGHQIPVWYCPNKECPPIASLSTPKECPNCGSSSLSQDPNVLDTWFSSGLWPFATLGWPEESEDLKYFYPTSTLVTDRGIIHLWVARMIILGLEFLKDIPFSQVYINPTVFNIEGKRMSKSLGTGVDPLGLMEKYGTDATRFGLITQCAKDQDLRFSEESLKASRNFANKLWNASRLVLMNLKSGMAEGREVSKRQSVKVSKCQSEDRDQRAEPPVGVPSGTIRSESKFKIQNSEDKYSLADRWILSRYNQAVREVTDCLDEYNFGEAAKTLYQFIWSEFCDWYLEIAKLDLYEGAEKCQSVKVSKCQSEDRDQRAEPPVGVPSGTITSESKSKIQNPKSKIQNSEDRGRKEIVQDILSYVLSNTLKLLHPFMPFITEEIFQRLPHEKESIMVSSWPEPNREEIDKVAEGKMEKIFAVIKAIRNLRAEVKIPPDKRVNILLKVANFSDYELLEDNKDYLFLLSKVDNLKIEQELKEKPKFALSAGVGNLDIYLPLKGVVDIEKEIKRLEKESFRLKKELFRVEERLSNQKFLELAPAEVVKREKSKREETLLAWEKVKERLISLG